jgi:hypothetical protein
MFKQSTDYQFQILFQNISVTKNSNPLATKPGNLTPLIPKHIILKQFYLPYKITFFLPMKNLKARFQDSGAVIGTVMLSRNVCSHPPTYTA